MHAILIAEENLEKIYDLSFSADVHQPTEISMKLYIERPSKWYFVNGYVSSEGKFIDWAIFPEFLFLERFEHDADKIKTDWDQIVRL